MFRFTLLVLIMATYWFHRQCSQRCDSVAIFSKFSDPRVTLFPKEPLNNKFSSFCWCYWRLFKTEGKTHQHGANEQRSSLTMEIPPSCSQTNSLCYSVSFQSACPGTFLFGNSHFCLCVCACTCACHGWLISPSRWLCCPDKVFSEWLGSCWEIC